MWDSRRNPNGVCTLIAIRDPQEHARRRKPWNRAFNTISVKGYEQILIRRALQLVGELEKRAQVKGGPLESAVNLAEWMKFFTSARSNQNFMTPRSSLTWPEFEKGLISWVIWRLVVALKRCEMVPGTSPFGTL